MEALVVDDNIVNRLLAARMLRKLGWTVTEVADGAAALDHLAANPVDVVLLDLQMPGMPGEEVVKRIRATGRGERVMAYTAHAGPEERRRLSALGFDGLLPKPVSVERICDALADLGIRCMRFQTG